MSSATSEIPQEVIDLVIDHFQADSSTLQSLGLVSKAWSQRTREHLFRDVQLKSWREAEMCAKLKSLLEERPMLRHYVKSLTIVKPYGGLELTLAILPLLGSLQRFSIFGSLNHLRWDLVQPDVRIALYGVMMRPHVTSITLASIFNFDVVPLTQYHHLEELILDDVQVLDYASVGVGACFPLNVPSPSSPPSCLRLLAITTSSRALRTLLTISKCTEATLRLSDLTHLKVTTSENLHDFTDAEWASLLDTCGASIESYTVDHRACYKPFSAAITPFYRFPKLKEVFFKINCIISDSEHDSFPLFVEALDQLSRTGNETALTTIQVEWSGCAQEIGKEVNDLLGGPWWRWLDEIMQRPVFLSLTNVRFGFTYSCCATRTNDSHDGMSSGVRSQLSTLDRKGVLVLT